MKLTIVKKTDFKMTVDYSKEHDPQPGQAQKFFIVFLKQLSEERNLSPCALWQAGIIMSALNGYETIFEAVPAEDEAESPVKITY